MTCVKLFCLMVLIFCIIEENTSKASTLSPVWPTSGCNFTRHPGNKPRAWNYTGSITFTQNECEKKCLQDERCGSYSSSAGPGQCSLYQMSDKLFNKITMLPEEGWRESDSSVNMGSKECNAIVTETTCDKYSTYDRKEHGVSHDVVAQVYITPPLNQTSTISHVLRSTACKSLCDAYDECVSVGHYIKNNWFSMCTLYNITLTELFETGRGDEVENTTNRNDFPIFTTYDCDITELTDDEEGPDLATIVAISMGVINLLLLTGGGAAFYFLYWRKRSNTEGGDMASEQKSKPPSGEYISDSADMASDDSPELKWL